MEKISNGGYTKEFQAKVIKMARDRGLSLLEISKRQSLPKSTLENWIRFSKAGHLGNDWQGSMSSHGCSKGISESEARGVPGEDGVRHLKKSGRVQNPYITLYDAILLINTLCYTF